MRISVQKNWALAAALVALGAIESAAQQGFEPPFEWWFGYISSARINARWSVWNDAHYSHQAFFITRHGLTYSPHRRIQITGGYAWLITATSFSRRLVRPEHRPWGQIEARLPLTDKLSYRVRFRYDARFRKRIAGVEILDDYVFYHRLRLMQGLRYDIGEWRSRKIHFNLLTEALTHHGREAPDQRLDQIRLFAMPGLSLKNATIMGGYHLRYAIRGGAPVVRQGLTVWVVQQF